MGNQNMGQSILHRKFEKRFLYLNLFTKLMIMLMLISILPIISIQFTSYKISTSTIEKQTKELITAYLWQSSNSVEGFFHAYDNMILGIYTDSSYIDNLEYINVWDTKNYYSAKYQIEKKLENIVYTYPEILGIAIVGLNGDAVFYDAVTLSGEDSFCFDVSNFRTSPMLKASLKAKHTIYSATVHKSDSYYGDRNFFYIAHQLTDFNNYKNGPVGNIVLCIDELALRKVYSSGIDFNSNITFLINQKGEIISFPLEAYVGKSLYEGVPERNIESATKSFFQNNNFMASDKLEVHISSIKDGAFTLINVQNLAYALKDVENISMIIILIGILFGIICIFIAMSFAAGTDKSVKTIIHAMQKADLGDYSIQIALEGNDEFARIAHHFNDMILRIRESSEQEREALVRKKNAEIRSLEAQINPHFLYNTLDAINWVAVEHEEFHISKMLINLATILRYSIQRGNEIVTLREELEYLQRYIALQQERFCYSFQYYIHMNEELKSCKIHKLLLQPLIENSIVHGFPGGTGHDAINIAFEMYYDTYLKIRVKDNGKGMSRELVESFNSYNYRQDKIESSIGVRNVITRLKLYYGSNSYFHAESDETGTCVTIMIPYEL
jgi:two-component system, sensor histidine kinase YesM